MGNGALTSFVTAEGGGGVRWRDLEISRWKPDPVDDAHGMAIYLRDQETEETFGATPWPVHDWPTDGHIRFEAGSVEFARQHEELTIRTRITVASGDDVELREIEIANVGNRARRIEVAGCLEPVVAPGHEAARHPAFSKLFLRCTEVEELAGVLVSRLGEHEGHPPPMMLFRMFGDAATQPRVVETDRGRFLGRHGSLRSPAGLRRPGPMESEHTLDPMCACAAELELPPGSSRVVGFITAVAPSRSAVLELARRFGNPSAVRWAFEDTARAAARRVASLEVSPDLLPSAQRLLSGLVVGNTQLRAPEETLAEGRPSQRKLWGRGISGDEPIVLVRMDSGQNPENLGDTLDVHRYLRSIGIPFDLVLVDEAATGYGDQGADTLRRFLSDRGVANLLHQRGGIHIVHADQTPGGELIDLAAAARVTLDARETSLQRQLAREPESVPDLPPFEPAGPPPGASPNPELSLDVPELSHDNGYGGFAGDEYVVRPGVTTPAPWSNVIANAQFGCLTTEAGLGSTWSLNAGENRLTPWRNDPVIDPPAEALYIRDEETGRVWSTTPQPAGVPTLVRHGQGYTSYESVVDGLEETMKVFVPPDAPLKIVRLRIRNHADRPRRLTGTYYAEWVLGTRRSETKPYIVGDLSVDDACLLARTSWSMDFAGRVAFLATDQSLHGWTTDRVEMLGRGGGMDDPAALRRWGLSGRVAPGLDPCAAVQVHIELGPGEETEVSFFLGQVDDREAALETVRRYRKPGEVERAWQECQTYWDEKLTTVTVDTPDADLNRLCNRWLLYQSLSSRFFGRTAYYQSSGAYGFRDQLQDGLAFVHCDPSLTRAHILKSAAHQFTQGDVLHWWHPPGDAGVRTRCSDDLLWLVYVTAEYVEATGDVDILDEEVPFLAGEALGPTEETRYGRFGQASSDGTLLEHCRRAVARASTSGPHGIPLIGHGDWNDGMDRVGAAGRGESVWLGWFLHRCTEQLAAMLDRVGESGEAETWRERLPVLREALREHAWDGAWYLRAFHDDGTPVGSAHSAPPHIDSIAQSWAALSGAGDPERIENALDAVERTLVNDEDRLVLLLAPPFGPRGPDPGYIAEYPPGVRENGGQYTHAATWLGFAYALQGDGDGAHRIFSLLNPLERTRSRAEVDRYCVEPYVIAADVYARPPWVGRGGWTWYTGSAAWTWRLAVEAILGIRRRDGELEISPCIPAHWDGFEATVTEGNLTVHVVVHNNDGAGHGVGSARLDGTPIDAPRVALSGSGERRLDVWLGEAKRPRLHTL
jgi:cyclic beta-1,2-glucan synthetase